MFEPSEYQKRVLDYIKNEKGNLLIDAKAGAGKTSTLILISDELKQQNKKCLFLAFNKNIISDLAVKLPDTDFCCVRTLHSVGKAFLSSYFYKKYGKDKFYIDSSEKHTRSIIRGLFESMCMEKVKRHNLDLNEDEFKELCNNIVSDVLTVINFVRFYLIDFKDEKKLLDFIDSDKMRLSVLDDYMEIGMEDIGNLVVEVMKEKENRFNNPEFDSNKDQYIINIDYADMLYYPLEYNIAIPYSIKSYLDYVLTDEAQDLNILEHKFLKTLHNWNNTTRYIFVGDRKQAIYGFAGADTRSMDNIKNSFYLKELPLNICYRCPEAIIRLAQDIVPDIEWNKARDDKGVLKIVSSSQVFDLVEPGDMILGRFNRDLLMIYKDFVLQRRKKIKFMNLELVNSIFSELRSTMSEYVIRYNRCENIEMKLLAYMRETNIPSSKKLRDKSQEKLVKDYANELQKANMKVSKMKMKKDYNLEYLLLAMEEYKKDGSYSIITEFENDIKMYLYFDIIKSFIKEYMIETFDLNSNIDEKDYAKYLPTVKVDDFLDYLDEFLHGNDYAVDVPILSSIHGMKGKEADRVFIIDYPCFPYWTNGSFDQSKQEVNLQYVAITRAKKSLYLMLVDEDKIEDIDKKVAVIAKNQSCTAIIDEINRNSGIYEESTNIEQDSNKSDCVVPNSLDIDSELIKPRKYNESYFDNKMI